MTSVPRFVVITGLSGAGKTQALKFFEDQSFYCVDNLPAALLPTFAELLQSAESPHRRVAVCVDARSGEDLANLSEYLNQVRTFGFRPEVLFLDTSDDIIQRRYSETRRPHPASPSGSITEGIQRERGLLGPIRERADLVIDTSTTSNAELHDQIASIALEPDAVHSMSIALLTFGYKHGVPKEADLVFDVRFLPNPHYVDELRPRDGRDTAVRRYVLENEAAQSFLYRLTGLLEFLIPQYAAEPKSYLTIAIGCTGGRHRSVAIAEELTQFLRTKNYSVVVRHRDAGLPSP